MLRTGMGAMATGAAAGRGIPGTAMPLPHAALPGIAGATTWKLALAAIGTAAAGTGTPIARLNSDCVMTPSWFASIMSKMSPSPRCTRGCCISISDAPVTKESSLPMAESSLLSIESERLARLFLLLDPLFGPPKHRKYAARGRHTKSATRSRPHTHVGTPLDPAPPPIMAAAVSLVALRSLMTGSRSCWPDTSPAGAVVATGATVATGARVALAPSGRSLVWAPGASTHWWYIMVEKAVRPTPAQSGPSVSTPLRQHALPSPQKLGQAPGFSPHLYQQSSAATPGGASVPGAAVVGNSGPSSGAVLPPAGV
mmetsp:Transcript_79263/g.236169  ORF Transcript_79263/g.236169 Transcript_79263/m.236169 type:complete len:312 (+) Transcript_79263:41-976(+)